MTVPVRTTAAQIIRNVAKGPGIKRLCMDSYLVPHSTRFVKRQIPEGPSGFTFDRRRSLCKDAVIVN